jgi:hypothetical protein
MLEISEGVSFGERMNSDLEVIAHPRAQSLFLHAAQTSGDLSLKFEGIGQDGGQRQPECRSLDLSSQVIAADAADQGGFPRFS